MTSPDSYPKVLVGVVTYDGKHYIFPENYQCITSFDYPNYDWIIVDNSSNDVYVRKLRREGYKKVHKIKRAGNSRDTLSDSQNYVKNYFVKGDYDYLLMVESDLLPPPNTISRLMSYKLPIVGALYYLSDGVRRVPCIFFTDYKKEHASMGTRLIRQQEVSKFVGSGLRKVHGMGFGCALIRRDIIKDYNFWTDERFDNKHSDVYFYMQLQNRGVPVFVDTDFVVTHIPSKWGDVKDK